MANEITLSTSLTASKGGASVTSGTSSKSLTMTGGDMYQATQSIPTSANGEVVAFGDITQPAGQVLIKNLDAANFVTFALGDTGMSSPFAKLRAGCSMLFEPVAAAIYCKADTGAVVIQVTAVET